MPKGCGAPYSFENSNAGIPFSSSFVVLNTAWSGYQGLALDVAVAEPVVVVGGLVLPELPELPVPPMFDDVE
jgi:hypothetical protein